LTGSTILARYARSSIPPPTGQGSADAPASGPPAFRYAPGCHPACYPPAPAAAQAPCPPVSRRSPSATASRAKTDAPASLRKRRFSRGLPYAPLHAACSWQAPCRRTSVTDACWSHAAFRSAYPRSLRACHSACFATRHAQCQALRSPPSGVSLRSISSSPAAFPCCASSAALRLHGLRLPGDTPSLRCGMTPVSLRPFRSSLPPRAQHRNAAPQLLATQIVQFDHVVPLAERVPFVPHSTRSAASPPFSSLHNLLAALPRLASSPPSGRAAPGLRDRMRSSASSGTQPDTPSLRISLTPSRSNCSVLHYAPNAALRTAAPSCPP